MMLAVRLPAVLTALLAAPQVPAPVKLTCLRWTMCFTDADEAAKVAGELKDGYAYDPKVIFTETEVLFVDRSGAPMRVTFR